MKRILSILLALLMIMCFVGCKEPETDFNDVTKPATKPTTKPETKPETTPSEPDSVDDELILSIPELPKSEGTDPFLGLYNLVFIVSRLSHFFMRNLARKCRQMPNSLREQKRPK